MSIDLDIIPTIERAISWADLKSAWSAYMNEAHRQMFSSKLVMKRLGANIVIDDSELLGDDCYYFEMGIDNTLGFCMNTNERNMIAGHEQELVADYGRNLMPEMIQDIAEKWSAVGYHYFITSGAGRGKHELGIMIALASALASLCEGWVAVDHGFGEPLHMYTAEQFKVIRPAYQSEFRWIYWLV